MSDESEIIRLEALLLLVAKKLAAKRRALSDEGVRYIPPETRPGEPVVAWIRTDDRPSPHAKGATRLEALRNLRDLLHRRLVRRRAKYDAAIAMLESE